MVYGIRVLNIVDHSQFNMTPSGILILMALVSHFVYVIYRAHNKLASGEVGTTLTTNSEKTVKGGY